MMRKTIIAIAWILGLLFLIPWVHYIATGAPLFSSPDLLAYITGKGAKAVAGDFILFGIILYYLPRVVAYFKDK